MKRTVLTIMLILCSIAFANLDEHRRYLGYHGSMPMQVIADLEQKPMTEEVGDLLILSIVKARDKAKFKEHQHLLQVEDRFHSLSERLEKYDRRAGMWMAKQAVITAEGMYRVEVLNYIARWSDEPDEWIEMMLLDCGKNGDDGINQLFEVANKLDKRKMIDKAEEIFQLLIDRPMNVHDNDKQKKSKIRAQMRIESIKMKRDILAGRSPDIDGFVIRWKGNKYVVPCVRTLISPQMKMKQKPCFDKILAIRPDGTTTKLKIGWLKRNGQLDAALVLLEKFDGYFPLLYKAIWTQDIETAEAFFEVYDLNHRYMRRAKGLAYTMMAKDKLKFGLYLLDLYPLIGQPPSILYEVAEAYR